MIRMAFIAALLPKEADRSALMHAAGEHRLLWADSWRGLNALVRDRPVAVVVTDLHAEPRKDGLFAEDAVVGVEGDSVLAPPFI